MAKKKKKRKIRFRFYLFVMAAVLLYAGYSLIAQWLEVKRLNAERLTLQTQIQSATITIEKLNSLLRIANTDSYIESIAREKLGWVMPNEYRYVIKDKP